MIRAGASIACPSPRRAVAAIATASADSTHPVVTKRPKIVDTQRGSSVIAQSNAASEVVPNSTISAGQAKPGGNLPPGKR